MNTYIGDRDLEKSRLDADGKDQFYAAERVHHVSSPHPNHPGDNIGANGTSPKWTPPYITT